MPLKQLPPKPNAPVIDSGDLLAFLKGKGVTVNGDTVIAHADGSVEVDTLATTSLTTAWSEYVPPAPPLPPPTLREQLQEELATVDTLEKLCAFVRDRLIPAAVRDEP